MKKITCEIIKDILPLYVDDVVSADTRTMVEEHLAECESCKKAVSYTHLSQKKISQIAKEVGFSNNSYFCRSFREYFGVTPEFCRKGTAEYEKMDTEI